MKLQKGQALLLAIFTLILVSFFLTAFLEFTTADLQIISNLLSKNQALYIADAGLEYALSNLRLDKNWKPPAQPSEFPAGSGNTYDVTYSGVSGKIVSIGRLISGQTLTIEAKVTLKGNASPYEIRLLYWRQL